MTLSAEGWVAIVIAVLSGLAWLFRLEGRISSHELVCAQRQLQLTERHDTTNRRLDGVENTLDRLDKKLDRVLETR